MDWRILANIEEQKLKRQQMRDTLKRWLLVAFVVLAFYLGFAESVSQSHFWQQVDKGMHFVLFGAFSFLFVLVAQQTILPNFPNLIRWFVTTFLLSLTCLLAEFVHLFVPGRTFEWGDMVANLSGSTIFAVVAALLVIPRELSGEYGIISTDEQAESFLAENSYKLRNPRSNRGGSLT